MPRRDLRSRPKPSAAAGGVSGARAVPSAFPWEDAMALGFGLLRWTPEAFWRATPRELAAAIDGLRGGARAVPQTRRELDRLMAAFPDE